MSERPLFAGMVGTLFAAAGGAPAGPAPPESRAADAIFVGAASCRPCHPEIASTYAHTGMGRAWSRMESGDALEDFSGARVVEVPGSPVRYRMTERDAQLRWFLVDPSARRRGLGTALLEFAVSFARERGYGSIFLWTVSALAAAGRLYTAAGFVKAEEKSGTFGVEVIEERYVLDLERPPR